MAKRCENTHFRGGWPYQCHRDAGTQRGKYDKPNCNICAAAYKRGEARRKANDEKRRANIEAQNVAYVERQRKLNDYDALAAKSAELRAVLNEYQYSAGAMQNNCPACRALFGCQHQSDCAWAAAIKEAE
ncbi:hypothetical protein LCGC14_2848310 [marine sediment metagenome]|uniref:Uncharacterized protein n=1 Tax=marine sediment metagenome TaxID=412755 RepID=A0A0F8YVY9_9ZZZZ